MPARKGIVTVRAEINGVRGSFAIDTGATYVAVKSAFARRAKILDSGSERHHAQHRQRASQAKLSRADKVTLGRLEAIDVPVAVQQADDKSYGARIDGLLGMSFLSRFEVQMAGGMVEIRTRQPRK